MMKKIITLVFAVLMLCQSGVFAKEIPITKAYDFKTVRSNYDSSLDGWTEKGEVSVGNGIKMTNGVTLNYNDNLGESFIVEGTVSNVRPYNTDVYSGHWIISLGEELNFKLGAGSNPIQRSGLFSGDTILVQHDGLSGSECRIKFRFEISGNTLKYSVIRYKLDGSVYTKVEDRTFDISSYSVGNFRIYGNKWADFLEDISFVYNKTVETGNIDVMPHIPQNGAKTADGITLHFSKLVNQTALENALTFGASGDAVMESVTVSEDGMSARVIISGAVDGEECTLSIPQGFEGANYDELEQTYVYTFTVDNTIKNDYPITVKAPGINDTVMYDGLRFDNEFYYSGEIALSGEAAYVYLASDAEGLSGYRAAIIPGESGKLRLERLENSVYTTVSEVDAKFAADGNVYFGAEVKENSLIFSVIGDSAFAQLEKADLNNTKWYVGVGCGAAMSSFKGLKVLINPSSTYEKPELVSASAPFDAYTIYESGETIAVELEFNIAPESLASYKVLVDEEIEFELTYIGTMGEGIYKYKAELSGVSEGAHTLKAVIEDREDNVFRFDSKGFMVAGAEKVVSSTGFTVNGAKITSLADAAGQSVNIEFSCSYSEYIIIACLYDENGEMKRAEYAEIDPDTADKKLTMAFGNDDLTGHTLNAFVVDKIYNSIPLSGVIELK